MRRTCEELDRRSGIEDSVLWKAPEDAEKLARRERVRRAYLRGDADPDADLGVDVEGERREEDERRRVGALGYANGLSQVVVDEDEDDEGEKKSADQMQEEADWLAQDVSLASSCFPGCELTDVCSLFAGSKSTGVHVGVPSQQVLVRRSVPFGINPS